MPTGGQRTTLYTGAVNSEQLVRDVSNEIVNVEGGYKNAETPLLVLTKHLNKKREVYNPKYEVIEDNYAERVMICSGAFSYNTTNLTVVSPGGSWLQKGALLYCPRTKERIYLNANPGSATALGSCIRNFGGAITGTGGTTAEGDGLALVSSDTLIHIGTLYAEGTYAPDAITSNVELSYNYTEIIKDTIDMSETLRNTKLYGEERTYDYQLKKRLIEHKMKIEFLLWFGARRVAQESASGHALRGAAGIDQHIQGNSLDISGAAYGGILTAKVLDYFSEKVHMNGSDTKYLFCSSRFANACSSILRQHIRIMDPKAKESYGLAMQEYITPNGRLIIVPHKKIFDIDSTLIGTAYALDLDFIKYVYLQNRDTKLFEEVDGKANNGYDGIKSEYLTECGLEMTGYGLDHSNAAVTSTFRSVHGVITGFSGY